MEAGTLRYVRLLNWIFDRFEFHFQIGVIDATSASKRTVSYNGGVTRLLYMSDTDFHIFHRRNIPVSSGETINKLIRSRTTNSCGVVLYSDTNMCHGVTYDLVSWNATLASRLFLGYAEDLLYFLRIDSWNPPANKRSPACIILLLLWTGIVRAHALLLNIVRTNNVNRCAGDNCARRKK